MFDLSNIIEIERKSGQWYDVYEKKQVSGLIIDYSISYSNIGNWLIQVKAAKTLPKVVVSAPWGSKTDNISNQLKSKSVIFQKSDFNEKYYNPIGIGYLKEERFHICYISEEREIPSEFLKYFQIEKYQDVKQKYSPKFNNKFVCVCGATDYQKMAYSFIIQRIFPVLE